MEWTLTAQDGRNPDERLTDRALLLLTVRFGEKVGRVDHFRLMKIPFTVQHQLNRQGVKSFSYRFYREDHGPISKAIYEDRDALRDCGLLEGGAASLRLTKLGDQLSRVVERQMREVDENARPLTLLEANAQRFASLPTWEAIKAEVYPLEIDLGSMRMTVAQAAPYTNLLDKLPSRSASGRVVLPENLKTTLYLAFSLTPDDIEAGCRDSGLTLDQVFSPAYNTT